MVKKNLEEEVNVSPDFLKSMAGMYSGLKGQVSDLYGKYENILGKIKNYASEIKKQKAVRQVDVTSPLVKHYLSALQYKKFLNKTLRLVYDAFEDFKKWETAYGKPMGAFGRFRAMRQLRKQKHSFRDLMRYARTAVPAFLLLASFFLLGFSASHMTGFAIAGNNIPSGYPVAAGFILLIITLCLSLFRRKKKKQVERKARKRKK